MPWWYSEAKLKGLSHEDNAWDPLYKSLQGGCHKMLDTLPVKFTLVVFTLFTVIGWFFACVGNMAAGNDHPCAPCCW